MGILAPRTWRHLSLELILCALSWNFVIMPYIALKLMDIRDHPVVLKTTSVVQKLLDHILEDESTLANCFLKADGDVHQMKRCFAHSPGGADAISYVWDLHAMIIEQRERPNSETHRNEQCAQQRQQRQRTLRDKHCAKARADKGREALRMNLTGGLFF